MYNYANRINVAANPEKDEIAISFMQNYPEFKDIPDEKGNPSLSATLKSESVAELIFTKDFAKEVAMNLLDTIK